MQHPEKKTKNTSSAWQFSYPWGDGGAKPKTATEMRQTKLGTRNAAGAEAGLLPRASAAHRRADEQLLRLRRKRRRDLWAGGASNEGLPCLPGICGRVGGVPASLTFFFLMEALSGAMLVGGRVQVGGNGKGWTEGVGL